MNTQAAVPLAAGEFGFDRTDFAFIANTLYEDAGISLPASKANLVYSRLAKRLRESLDCLKIFRARVTAEGWLEAGELDAIDSEVLALIDRAVAEARASLPPAEAELYADVYAEY